MNLTAIATGLLLASSLTSGFSGSKWARNPHPPLSTSWEIEKWSPKALVTPEVKKHLGSRHIVFIEGFLNEFSRGRTSRASLETTEEELETTASLLSPSSFSSVLDNADDLYSGVLDTYSRNNKPLILVGHSKGGVEALHLILKYPNLIWDKVVDQVVLLQSPVMGTPLAKADNANWPIQILSYPFSSGMDSLSRERRRGDFAKALTEFESCLTEKFKSFGQGEIQFQREAISNRLFYARSFQDYEQLSSCLKTGLSILNKEFNNLELSDGIIPTEDQKASEIGMDLGAVQADHIDFTAEFPRGSLKDRNSRAFFRALLSKVSRVRLDRLTQDPSEPIPPRIETGADSDLIGIPYYE